MQENSETESGKYIIHFHGEAKYIAIGDGASVQLSPPLVGVPFQVPPLPAYFVPRPEVSNALKARLFTNETSIPGALVISAIHGLGGIGKTTLVAALAHDHDLQSYFSDGILWATLGHEPDVLSLLSGWIQELHDHDFRPTVIESASTHLRTLLHDKACLLVVDDAWQAEHVRPFLVGKNRSRILITTRDATLARKVGARLYSLDVMTEKQALALFETRLGLLGDNRQQAIALAHELDFLPLALELASAQVEAGISWGELLTIFRNELADLAALDLDEATYRNESLSLSFRLSLDQLTPEDQKAFPWLGVLPIDAHLNPIMASILWDQSETDARRRLWRFRDKALLKSVGDERYALHDLLHHEAKSQLTAQAPLSVAHSALLARYRVLVQDSLWHMLPNDDYIHEHLIWHMKQAKQPDQIHALLKEETPEGYNGWYETREQNGQTAGYLMDIAHAWQLAREQSSISLQCRYGLINASLRSSAQGIPASLLIALVEKGIWTPIQGIAYVGQMSDSQSQSEALRHLADALTNPNHLTAILEATLEVKNVQIRADTLADLLPNLQRPVHPRAVSEIVRAAKNNEIGNRYDYSRLATKLIKQGYFEEALEIAQAIQEPENRAEALADLIPTLPRTHKSQILDRAFELMRQAELGGGNLNYAREKLAFSLAESRNSDLALRTALTITRLRNRFEAIARLAPMLSEPERAEALRITITAAEGIYDDYYNYHVLPELVSSIARLGSTEEALEIARQFASRIAQAKGLTELLPCIQAAKRTQTLQEALAQALQIKDKNDRARALVDLIPKSEESARAQILEEAMKSAFANGGVCTNTNTLASLAYELSAIHRPEDAFLVTLEISDDRVRDRTFAEQTSRFAEMGRTDLALSAVEQVTEIPTQINALNAIAPFLSKSEVAQVLKDAAEKVSKEDTDYRFGFYGNVVEQYAKRLIELGDWQEAYRIALGISGETGIYPRVFTALVPHLSETLKLDALEIANTLEVADTKALILATLALHLQTPQRDRLVRQAIELMVKERSYQLPYYRAEALILIALCLPQDLIVEAVSIAIRLHEWDDQENWIWETSTESKSEFHKALAALLSRVNPAQLPEILELVDSIESATERDRVDSIERDHALVRLSLHLAQLGHQEAALRAVHGVQSEQRRARAISILATRLEAGHLREAQKIAQEIRDVEKRDRALGRLVIQMTELGELSIALEAIQQITDEYFRALNLSRLANYLPEDLLTEALEHTHRFTSHRAHVVAISGVATHLPDPPRSELGDKALGIAHKIAQPDRQADALFALGGCLSEESMREALQCAQKFEDLELYLDVLVGLAHDSSEASLHEILEKVRNIEQVEYRGRALAEIASYLPSSLMADALEIIWEIPETAEFRRKLNIRAVGLACLAKYLPAGLMRETLDKVCQFDDVWARVQAVEALAPYLGKDLIWKALKAAGKGTYSAGRAAVAVRLAQLGFHREAVDAAEEVMGDREVAWTLARIAPYLPEAMIREIWSEFRAREAEQNWFGIADRATALVGLAPYLPEDLLGEAKEVAKGIREGTSEIGTWYSNPQKEFQVRVQVGMFYRLSVLGYTDEAIEFLHEIEEEYVDGSALASFAPYLPKEVLGQVLKVTQGFDSYGRARVLAHLPKHLSGELLYQALEIASKIEDTRHRAEAFESLKDRWLVWLEHDPAHGIQAWQDNFQILASRPREDLLSDLSALASVIAKIGGIEAIVETFNATQDVGRWWP